MAERSSPVNFLPLGALIQSFRVGNKNIVLGFPTEELYEAHNAPHFGVTVGRVANRIGNARIDSLNGRAYQLAANDGPNCLHGGLKGWAWRKWHGPTNVAPRKLDPSLGFESTESVQFQLTSEDGDQGFPGEVEAIVTYTTAAGLNAAGGETTVLEIEYEVKLLSGAGETVVNLTNHS